MMSKPRPNPMPLLIASMLLILPSLVYMALRAEMPGDGALLNLMGAVPGGSGLLIEDASGASSGLQDGDHLLAINGQSIDEWLESAWAFQGQTLAGENLRYTVSRAGELLTLQVRLERTDFIAQLGDNWASYLFLTYLLAVSAFTYYLKPDVPATRALLIASAAICASGLAFFTGLQATDVIRVWPFWIFIWGSIVIYALSMAAIGQFSLSFPRPRRILSERPRIAWLIFLALWIPYLVLLGIGWTQTEFATARLLIALRATGVFTAGYALIGLGILSYGYFRSFNARERRQTRWVLWAGAIVLVPWIGLSVIPPLLGANPILPQSVVGLFWLLLPTSIAIAVVRDNLFDIDRIINRTLVYSALTVVLASIYLLSVVSLQFVFRGLTGQESPLAIVTSTLAIAGLFSPLRHRVRGFIDRRFYRSRYDASRALIRMSDRMRDRVDMTDISQIVLITVDETLRPQYLSLWLRE